jgi:NAD(P)-dependent dehydrogenase (short-subunit alcohol dehydrogenase family)
MSRLLGRVALVTGAARGIGRGIARELARSGALVVGVDLTRDEPLARELTDLPGSPGGDSLCLDIERRDAVAGVLDEVVATYGRLDILVNNAGVGQQYAPLDEIHPEVIARVVGVNLVGTINCCSEAVARIADGTGRIINVASHYGLVGRPNFAPYSASKAGVIALTQSLAVEVAARGVTVNAVCPGTTVTEMVEEAYEQRAVAAGLDASEGSRLLEEFARASIPVGRTASPADMAATVAWLASDDASFITGSAINVSGGETLY